MEKLNIHDRSDGVKVQFQTKIFNQKTKWVIQKRIFFSCTVPNSSGVGDTAADEIVPHEGGVE